MPSHSVRRDAGRYPQRPLTACSAATGCSHSSRHADNFTRAESDSYFANIVKQAGGTGKIFHRRELEPVDNQIVIRANRDTLYSAAVFDLNAGPLTVVMPDAGKRFMSLIVIDEDQYVPAVHYGGSHTFTKEATGTRYVMLALRTLVDPGDPKDVAQAHALQDNVQVSQKNAGTLEIPNWDPVSHKKVKDALLVLASTLPDSDRGFGTKDRVEPVRRLILSASAWGGNSDKEAKYLNVKDVPVDGFWSISLYNASGNFEKNQFDAYSVNNITARKEADGSVTVQFGGCDGKVPELPADHAGLETTWCASIDRAPKSWTAHGSSPSRSR